MPYFVHFQTSAHGTATEYMKLGTFSESQSPASDTVDCSFDFLFRCKYGLVIIFNIRDKSAGLDTKAPLASWSSLIIACFIFLFFFHLGWCSVYRTVSKRRECPHTKSGSRVFREKVPSFNIMIGSTRPGQIMSE